MIRRPPRSTRKESSAASDVYKRQVHGTAWRREELLLWRMPCLRTKWLGLSTWGSVIALIIVGKNSIKERGAYSMAELIESNKTLISLDLSKSL
eukprot:TRINITY_DN6134_c0_g3_i2.p1 TRINITY_DN6134_c0_g3~~TRINITY_DN6134_c0_g3_i2.p1  ORF type:complete len:101 (+),score=15.38 TRINITY_DN6134_c0_g3_i2:24-305(+)